MWIPAIKSQLTPLERRQVRDLIIRDAISLASIFLITAALAVATYFLFKSYSDHRQELATRWFNRGKIAMQAHQPAVAIENFHSALLYAPGQRQFEIALASALASAGKNLEATAYFNTLKEAEPGNGEINLQLARLAAAAGNENLARLEFHAAIYGNWEGDGYIQRRNARLELIRYLISRRSYDDARSELLVASGNAPSTDLDMQSTIAGLLVEARFPADALTIYEQLLSQHPENAGALQGAASTAYALGEYQAAYRYLLRATTGPGSSSLDPQLKQADDSQLRFIDRIIVLDPSSNLPSKVLATRLLGDREIARVRLEDCLRTLEGGNTDTALSSLVATNIPASLQSVAGGWDAEPKHLTAALLEDSPPLELQERRLIGDTEKVTSRVCGAPTGDDAALLRLALVPSVADASINGVNANFSGSTGRSAHE